MTYNGIVEKGSVKLPPDWRDGTPVRVEMVEGEAAVKQLADVLAALSRKVEGLPSDLAANHDHYIRDVPAIPARPTGREAWLAQLAELRERMATGKTGATTEEILEDLRSDRG